MCSHHLISYRIKKIFEIKKIIAINLSHEPSETVNTNYEQFIKFLFSVILINGNK